MILKDILAGIPTIKQVIEELHNEDFSIEELADRYRLHNLPHHGSFCTVDWSKELIDHGTRHTQEDWIKLTQNTEWKLPSLPLYHSTITTLYKHKNSEQKNLIQKIRNTLKQDLEKHWMMTSTMITYNPAGKDTATHNYGYPNQYETDENIAGPGCGTVKLYLSF